MSRVLKIAGVALVGLYSLFWLGFLIDDFVQHGDRLITQSFGIAVVSFVVLGGFAWLGWRHPIAAGVLAIFPVTFPIGLTFAFWDSDPEHKFVSPLADSLLFVVAPAVIGAVFLAAGISSALAKRSTRLAAPKC